MAHGGPWPGPGDARPLPLPRPRSALAGLTRPAGDAARGELARLLRPLFRLPGVRFSSSSAFSSTAASSSASSPSESAPPAARFAPDLRLPCMISQC